MENASIPQTWGIDKEYTWVGLLVPTHVLFFI
nr:MAG TPA: hypothetical protein [Bacteriophage sp.]